MMSKDAHIEICEEPARKLKRLRYRTEGRTTPIEGVKTSRKKKTFPSIRIVNYTGYATIIVSTITADQPYRYHAHNLVGRNCKDGIYRIHDFYTDKSDPKVLSFRDLRIERCLKWEIPLRIMERYDLNISPFHRYKYNDNMQRDVHSLRLCFQVFIRPDSKNPNHEIQLEPKVSQPITNKKVAAEIKIDDISDLCSPASGGKKIMIFCNKIEKEDIQIRFFEEDAEKKETLIGWGDFGPHNVHGQVAIAFKTPKYDRKLDGGKQPNIFIEMMRPSDNTRSNRFPFQYVPDVTNIDGMMMRKREKIRGFKNLYEYMSTFQRQQRSPIQQYNMQSQNPLQINNLQQQYIPQGQFNPQQRDIASDQLIPSQQAFPLQHHNLSQKFNPQVQVDSQGQYNPEGQFNPQGQYNPQEQYNPQGQFNRQVQFNPQEQFNPQWQCSHHGLFNIEEQNNPQHSFEVSFSLLLNDDDQLMLPANGNYNSVHNVAVTSQKLSN